MLTPSALRAQTPKRGGVLTLRVWDPPHFDPYPTRRYPTCCYASGASRTRPSAVSCSSTSSATWPRWCIAPWAYSAVLPAVWDPALKNYAPNLGYDYGGRLMAAWLDR